MQALEWLLAALSIKTIALLNYLGGDAGYYATVAKFACCALAEAVVDEGRLIYGGRALLLDFPYQQRIGDVLLFGAFDGTSHLLLDQLQRRLARLAQNPAERQVGSDNPGLQQMKCAYQAPPQGLATSVRLGDSLFVLDPLPYLAELREHTQWLSVHPLCQIGRSLLALVGHCQGSGLWERDQGLRFDLAKQLAWLETLIALVELADPGVRSALGIARPVTSGTFTQTELGYAYGWFGGKVCAELRRLAYTVNGISILAAVAEAEVSFGTLVYNACPNNPTV